MVRLVAPDAIFRNLAHRGLGTGVLVTRDAHATEDVLNIVHREVIHSQRCGVCPAPDTQPLEVWRLPGIVTGVTASTMTTIGDKPSEKERGGS